MSLGAIVIRGLPRCIVVLIGCLKQFHDAGPFSFNIAALMFEVSTNGASEAVFIHLADVVKDVTGLGALFIPLFEELLKANPMSTQTPGPLEANPSLYSMLPSMTTTDEKTELSSYPKIGVKK